jgi:hypothetical protein
MASAAGTTSGQTSFASFADTVRAPSQSSIICAAAMAKVATRTSCATHEERNREIFPEDSAMPYAHNVGIRIHYQVEGEGRALVLHHGFSESVVDWYEAGYVEALKADYRLILIDARGHRRQ